MCSSRQAAKTGQDSFLLGPSGAGFLHPSLINASDPLLQGFVNETLDALKLLGASAYVQWDEYNNLFNNTGQVSMHKGSICKSTVLGMQHESSCEAGLESARGQKTEQGKH